MSLTVESTTRKLQNNFIEWDTVRGRGDFDAGYVNEFLYTNENGEIDEQKRKEFEENPQYKLIKTHKTSSCGHRRSRLNLTKNKSATSDTQVTKKSRKPRTVKLSSQKQSMQGSQTKSENNWSELKDSE